MPKIISFSMELTDEEHANFLARLAERGALDGDEDDSSGEGTGPAPTGDVDAKGTPWLAEFHSAKKTTNADGTWRLKRGADAAKAKAAEEAARANAGVNTAPASIPTGANAMPASLPTGGGLPTGLPTGLPGLPATAPAPAPVTYEQIVAKFNELSGAGKLAMEAVPALYAAAGVTDPNELTTNETLRVKLMEQFTKIG